MKRIVFTLLMSVMLLLSACGSSGATKGESLNNGNVGAQDMENLGTQQETGDSAEGHSSQLLIITYDMDVECEDVKEASDKIKQSCSQSGGYVESENSGGSYGNIVIRIPSKNGESFVKFVEDSFDVQRSYKNTEDITDSYVDNDARLENLKAEEQQILEIMKKASTVDEILSVQSRLYQVRGDIESLEARKKSWDNQVQYSSVTISIHQKALVNNSSKSIISGSEFVKAVKRGFINSGVGLILFFQRIVIFLISNILVILILAGAAFAAVKAMKKRNGRKQHGEKDKAE